MQVALIPPASYIRKLFDRPMEMIIPEALKSSPDYKNYYQVQSMHRISSGSLLERKFLILDNGAFESKSIGMLELLSMARTYRVDEIVAPDVPGNSYITMQKLEQFLDLIHATYHTSPFRVMVAITGNNLAECKGLIAYVATLQKAGGVQTLGLPKHLVGRTKHDNARVSLVKWINREYANLFDIHALGYNWPGEVQALAQLGIRSIDTDAPFRAAYHGVHLNAEMELEDRPEGYWTMIDRNFASDLVSENIRLLDGWAR